MARACKTARMKALSYIRADLVIHQIDKYQFSAGDREYLVLTNNEADKRAIEYIEDSLWAFNAKFLAAQTGIDELVFTAIQNNHLCESNNDALRKLVGSRASFLRLARAAIAADGRANFLNTYDDRETQITAGRVTFNIYRID